MLCHPRDGVSPDEPGSRGPIRQLEQLKKEGYPLVYVGDVVGTGSSRKSATNSILWHLGNDIPWVPNKRSGGFVFGGNIAPIFFNTLEDSGALPLEMDVSALSTGMLIDLYPYRGEVRSPQPASCHLISLKTDVLLDEVRAGGHSADYWPQPDGQSAAIAETCASDVFRRPKRRHLRAGFTLAQKIVGEPAALPGSDQDSTASRKSPPSVRRIPPEE
jgi:aconitate hydratase 2/2-methylisocitrate dehydratase